MSDKAGDPKLNEGHSPLGLLRVPVFGAPDEALGVPDDHRPDEANWTLR